MNSYSKLRALSISVAFLILSACGGNDVKVTSSFSNTQDIKEGAVIYLDGVAVGEVSDVKLAGSGAEVELSLDAGAVKNIGSASAIVVNRLKKGAPLEIVNRNSRDESSLQDGQSIKGLDSMLQLGAWMVSDAIQLGSGTASQYLESFQSYLNSAEFDQDKQAVQAQIDSAKEAAQQTIKNVEQEFKRAAKDLESTEQEAAATIQQLGDELAPLVEGLASQGSQLMQELEQFTAGLESVDADEKLAGQQFLDSLLATLEKLNQSIEKGASDAAKQSDQVGQSKE